MRRDILSGCALAALIAATPVGASETITYSYDARGRLTEVAHSGSVNNGLTACYAYDKADNRTSLTVASGGCAASPVSFSIASNGPVTEGAPSTFTISKVGTAGAAVSVSYGTSNGTAVAPGDYGAVPVTSVTFQPSETSKLVSVATVDDSVTEPSETFAVNLSSPSAGTTIATGAATATINDNDANATCSGIAFSMGDASATEGGSLLFTVTKSGSTSVSCSVNYATANGSATTIGGDYTAASGTLTFTATQSALPVSVATKTDSRTESDETMVVNLSGATTGATISDSQGVGTIFDANGCGVTCQ